MKTSMPTSRVTELLDALYADAAKNDPLVREAAREAGMSDAGANDFYRAMRTAYMPVSREFGNLLYVLARGSQAKTVVEFGTSFGISTIFLASAIRDNGGGQVITTEFDPEKAERAKQNLAVAGLEKLVELRVGDALETLSNPPHDIDMIFLDGAKSLYLDVLRLLKPHLRPAGIIASDNTDHDGMEAFLAHVRDPGNGYLSSAILTAGGIPAVTRSRSAVETGKSMIVEPKPSSWEAFPKSTVTADGILTINADWSDLASKLRANVFYATKSGVPLHLHIIEPKQPEGEHRRFPLVVYVRGPRGSNRTLVTKYRNCPDLLGKDMWSLSSSIARQR